MDNIVTAVLQVNFIFSKWSKANTEVLIFILFLVYTILTQRNFGKHLYAFDTFDHHFCSCVITDLEIVDHQKPQTCLVWTNFCNLTVVKRLAYLFLHSTNRVIKARFLKYVQLRNDNQEIENKACWRQRVVVAFSETSALVLILLPQRFELYDSWSQISNVPCWFNSSRDLLTGIFTGTKCLLLWTSVTYCYEFLFTWCYVSISNVNVYSWPNCTLICLIWYVL